MIKPTAVYFQAIYFTKQLSEVLCDKTGIAQNDSIVTPSPSQMLVDHIHG